MGKIYEKIKEEEILCKDVVVPEYFPAIYIDEYDNVYCYAGIIDKNRFLFGSCPYWLKGRKPKEINNSIRGYFRIKNGKILQDKKFIDEKNSFNEKAKFKMIPAHVHFPAPQDMTFGIYSSTYQDLEKELTAKVFGISYDDLLEILYQYNNIFKVAQKTYFNNYPKITRSIKNNNYCDLSGMWIPKEFPYIAFCESDYYYSHISLYGFYQHMKFITSCDIDSIISKQLISNGLNPEILNVLFNMDSDDYISRPIDEYLFNELNDCYQ